jgi:hypothetical protein
MAKLPVPQRGQPLDVTYIYSVVDAVNDLSTQISSATYNYTTIDTISSGKQNTKTSETRIIGAYIPIYSEATVTAGTEKTFTYDITDFKYSPIVTATPVNIGQTPAGQNVSVTLNTPTTSRIEGTVRFGASGNLSLAVNLIIVGIPN